MPMRFCCTANPLSPRKALFAFLILALLFSLSATAQAQQHKPAPGSQWQMVLVKGQPQIDPSLTTLNVGDDHTVSGNTGCNHYAGKIIGTSDSLFGKLATTRKSCPSAVSEQEKHFLKAMAQATSWSVNSDTGQLALRDEDNKPLALFIPRQDPEYYFDCGSHVAHVVLRTRQKISLTYQGRTHAMNRVEGGNKKRFSGDGMKFEAKGRNGKLTTEDGRTLDCHLVPKPGK